MRHFCWLKSSTSESGIAAFAFALVFETFALAFVLALTLLLRFSLRVLALRLLVLAFEPRLASAMIITTIPTPMTSSAASPPSIHQTALDFLRGGAAWWWRRPLWRWRRWRRRWCRRSRRDDLLRCGR